MTERVLLDGSVTPMQIHRPAGKPKAIVVFFPGFGMGARYYWPMAQELRDRGFGVLVSELRGQGGQTAKATRRHQWGYHELAAVDYPAAVAAARTEFEEPGERLPVYLMCHSMGGQIGALYLRARRPTTSSPRHYTSRLPRTSGCAGVARWTVATARLLVYRDLERYLLRHVREAIPPATAACSTKATRAMPRSPRPAHADLRRRPRLHADSARPGVACRVVDRRLATTGGTRPGGRRPFRVAWRI